MSTIEHVILVDEHNNELGLMEKMEAHRKGKLHRAFSVLIFNSAGEMLLQQRGLSKYHSAGLWTNACCSHPRAGEDTQDAAHRRLQEEMGFNCALKPAFNFIYKAPFDNGLFEHELDFVFEGTYDGTISLNPDEAANYQWIQLDTLIEEMWNHPEQFTVWFRIILKKYVELCSVQR
jgi:isopentenyl-diphosphate delta-isomerase